MLALADAGAVVFENGNNLRVQAVEHLGEAAADGSIAFRASWRPTCVRCSRGDRPVPLGSALRVDTGSAGAGRPCVPALPGASRNRAVDRSRPAARAGAGSAGAVLLAGPWRTLGLRGGGEQTGRRRIPGSAGTVQPRPPRLRGDDAPADRHRRHARRFRTGPPTSRCWTDCCWPRPEPTWSRSTPAVAATPAGCSQPGYRSSPTAAETVVRLRRALDADTGLGVLRHASAGYPEAEASVAAGGETGDAPVTLLQRSTARGLDPSTGSGQAKLDQPNQGIDRPNQSIEENR